MPILTVPIAGDGAIVQLAIAVSAPRQNVLASQNHPIPDPVLIRGLIDTGASCTCVDPTVIEQLGIEASGTASMLTPSTGATPHVCNQFDVVIVLLLPMPAAQSVHPLGFTIPILEADLAHHGFHALVGRHEISRGMLVFNGRDGLATLAF